MTVVFVTFTVQSPARNVVAPLSMEAMRAEISPLLWCS
jgi:hypothetical protein